MTTAIIDYGSGNLRSAAKAFERAATESGANGAINVTADPAAVAAADRIVLPGVGAFADCKAGLAALDGMIDALDEQVTVKGKPFLGICVGMQLMAERGIEFGTEAGLGWCKGEVRAIAPADPSLKVPHMGWNELHFRGRAHPVFAGVGEGEHVYFVHSYAFFGDPDLVLAEVDYGGPVTAAIARDNMVGTQFHPEKSQAAGLRLISNFLNWTP